MIRKFTQTVEAIQVKPNLANITEIQRFATWWLWGWNRNSLDLRDARGCINVPPGGWIVRDKMKRCIAIQTDEEFRRYYTEAK